MMTAKYIKIIIIIIIVVVISMNKTKYKLSQLGSDVLRKLVYAHALLCIAAEPYTSK